MGHYKDAPSNRGAWRNADRKQPCPICGHDTWCSIRRDGAKVACRRDFSEGHRMTDRSGVDYSVHTIDRDSARILAVKIQDEKDPDIAPTEARDRAYRTLLGILRLHPHHAKALRERGLSEQQISDGCYATLHGRDRVAIAARVHSVQSIDGVPGFTNENRPYLLGSPGLLVPVLDVYQRIVALKVRLDATTSARYLYLTSSRFSGPAAECAVHVPNWNGDRTCVRITEGELKADVATALSGTLTISVPGVGSWRRALDVLPQLGAKQVRVAFDMDRETNPHVAEAQLQLVKALRRAGYSTLIESWDPKYKGIDDVLNATMAGVAA